MDIKTNPKIVLVAGEPSGDILGAGLIKALKKKVPGATFHGVGGTLMEKEGIQSFYSVNELSVMGFFEAMGHLFAIRRRLKETVQKIQALDPDVVVTIDFPGFNFMLARALKKRLKNTRRIHYVAPTVWAWKKKRAKKVSKILDHLIALFPFEPPYFKKHKLKCTFAGHPITEMGFDAGDGPAFKKKHGIAANETVFILLPGSRESELNQHIPVFLNLLKILGQTVPRMRVVIPTLPHLLPHYEKKWVTDVPSIFVTDVEEKKDAYAAGNLAIAASGTIALELAEAKLPMLITYKVSRVTAWLVRRLVETRYFCMINILLRRRVVPELLQEDCTGSKIALEALKVLRNPQKRQQQQDAFKRVHKMLRPNGALPSEKAAEVVLEYLKENTPFK